MPTPTVAQKSINTIRTLAMDDAQALLAAERRVIRFDLETAVANGLRRLTGRQL